MCFVAGKYMSINDRIVVRSSTDNHVLFKVFRAVYKHNATCGDILPYIEHRHSELEISVISSGSGIYSCCGIDYDFKEGDIFLHCGNDVHCFKYISPEERLSLLVLQFDPRLIWTHCGEWFNPKYLQLFTGNNLNSRHLSNDTPEAKEIASLMDECFRECCKQQPAYEMIVKAKLLLILSILVRYYYDYFPQNNAEMDSRNINHIERSMDYILRNLSTQLTLQDIANEAHMSRSYYSATFKQLNGVSVWGYITSQRINRAQHLLESTTLPVIEISEYCGYNNIANFNRSFKKITGKTPRVYRKDYLSALAKKGGNNEEESRSPHIAYN